ncbi:MAG: hypothetical protein ACFE0Q_05580 [Anaerolineae bacterium]
MSKRKGHFEGQIRQISDLPLSTCVARLEALASPKVAVEMHAFESDRVMFRVDLLERGIVRAQAIGTLRRWEGTLTRMDCEVTVREGVMLWLAVIAMSSLLTMIGLPALLLFTAGISTLIWWLISAGFVALLVAMVAIANRYAPFDDTPENLFALITTALESAPNP